MPRLGHRLAIVQHSGDFREASYRLASAGPETYRGQRYTVNCVEGLADQLESVTTITGLTASAYEELLPSGGVAIGAGCAGRVDGRQIVRLLARLDPDLLILRTPLRHVLLWAAVRRRRTLLLLADSFDTRSIKTRLAVSMLALFAKLPNVDWIGNHGYRSAEQLVDLGIPARKVVAWDYPAFDSPEARQPKSRANDPSRIMYVGMMIPEKGVDDLIAAVRRLVDGGRRVQLDLVGRPDDGRLVGVIAAAGLEKVVHRIGPVENARIVPMMRAADVVVVPSRHEYSEGMPLTIYEALCSRTPLVVSDHPMFAGNIVDEESGLTFPGGDVKKLASAIERLLDDPGLYQRISEQSLAAWRRLQIPLKWGELIDAWIENSSASRARLASQSFANKGR